MREPASGWPADMAPRNLKTAAECAGTRAPSLGGHWARLLAESHFPPHTRPAANDFLGFAAAAKPNEAFLTH